MIDHLLRDAQLHPGLFFWRGPLPISAIEDWERRQSLAAPSDLKQLWSMKGGVDVFESETIHQPFGVRTYRGDTAATPTTIRGVFVRLHTKVALTLVTCLSFGSISHGQVHEKYEGWCSHLKDARPFDVLRFLDTTTPNEENARCVKWAINKLGQDHYEPAIASLVKLLDFRQPQTETEKVFHDGLVIELFPAEEALSLIGSQALPELLFAIKQDKSSVALRENAVHVWMEIYRQSDQHPKGVADLQREQIKPDNRAVKQRLSWAVKHAVALCNPPDQAECRKAASSFSSNLMP